ncbi:14-3-3-like protein F [Apostasia shenzhenica]|uniref:14-3-3-like protein F n=1 Tax=Apostasia shenzhenica TaxID=1088818 RepID=A0A2I0ABM4_9ASPA|nr:14-3-3-like protein F [Apostasia shenzhenica]
MANARDQNLYFAKLADQAQRYEDMVTFMEKVAEAAGNGSELTAEERNLLSAAYKKASAAHRASWRILLPIEQKEKKSGGRKDRLTKITEYKVRIQSDLSSICDRVHKLLDRLLIPSASTSRSKVFYLKMKGDYYRYLAELETGSEREVAAGNALAAYNSAQNIAMVELLPTDPIRLRLALNFSVFYCEIMNAVDQACSNADQTIKQAIATGESMCEEYRKESILILQLIRDNLIRWTAELEEKGVPYL